MGFVWHEPRKRTVSADPRITMGKKFISINPICIEKYFKGKEYAKVGFDEKSKKLILVPVGKDDKHGMKVISNANSTQRYINAERVFQSIGMNIEIKGEYRCSWDDDNKGVVIDIEKDKVG